MKKIIEDLPESLKSIHITLIFPINVEFVDGCRRGFGDHWTTLILDLKKFEWVFNKSLQPRGKGDVDKHLADANIVVRYALHEYVYIWEILFFNPEVNIELNRKIV